MRLPIVWALVCLLLALSCAPEPIRARWRSASSTSTGGNNGSGSGGSGGSGGAGAGQFEIAFEHLDAAVDANGHAGGNAESTQFGFNTTEFDGVTAYVWEIVASNTAGVAKNFTLVDSVGGVKSTIAVDAGASLKRFTAAFTPNAGYDTYRINLPNGAGVNLAVYASRIRIQQSSATKTRVFIPLTSTNMATTSHIGALPTGPVDSIGVAAYGQVTPESYGVWRYDTSSLANIAAGIPWRFETVLSTMGAANCAVALFNKTDNTIVVGTAVTLGGATIHSLQASTFASGAVGF